MRNNAVAEMERDLAIFIMTVLVCMVCGIVAAGYVLYETHRYRQTCVQLPGYYREAILVDINQPKHFVGGFIDIDTDGTRLSGRKEHRSKHCNGWRKLRIGMKFQYYIRREKCEDGRFEDADLSLHAVLCSE